MSVVMNDMEKSIGARIKEQRKKKGWRQEDLGTKVNVSSQVVSNWERHYSTPDSSDVQALSTALNVSADYLLCNTDDPQQVLSGDAKKFLEVVDLDNEEAIEVLKAHFNFKGKKLPEEKLREILNFARFRLGGKE